MKSRIRVYEGTKFLGFFVGLRNNDTEIMVSNQQLSAKLFDSEETRSNVKYSLLNKFPGKQFV